MTKRGQVTEASRRRLAAFRNRVPMVGFNRHEDRPEWSKRGLFAHPMMTWWRDEAQVSAAYSGSGLVWIQLPANYRAELQSGATNGISYMSTRGTVTA